MGNQGIDLFYLVRSSGPMVLFVLLLLLLFSVTTWTIIVVKYRYIRRVFRESAHFMDFFWKSRDLSEAFAQAKQMRFSPIARVFRIGYVELKKVSQSGHETKTRNRSTGDDEPGMRIRMHGSENIQRAMRRGINTEVTRMTRMVPFLATTGNTAPFIGLFGTVWGIMNSFHQIGQMGSASLATVAPGISEALIATAAGLAAAIPAVIAFNHFMQKIKVIETELQGFSSDFLNIVERDIL